MKKLFAVLLLAAFLPALAAFSLSNDGRRIITLNGDSVEFTGSGISVSGTQITLTEPGEYYVTGTLNDGTIFINTGASTEKISVILDSASITCLSGPAIYVQQAEKLRLCMAEGTENTITSGTPDMADTFDDSRSGGAIFAEDDMDINAGRIITEGASLQDIRQEILACIERTASGIPTKSECLGHQEYSLGYKSFCAISSQ